MSAKDNIFYQLAQSADQSEETSEQPEKKNIFHQLAEKQPSRTRSLISAPIKGGVKGALDIAALSDPFKVLLGVSETTPLQKKAIETILPTQDRPLEKGLERAGRIGASAIGGPESLLAKGVRTAAGAGLGQLAEEAGAPELVQSLAELGPFLSPKFGKDLVFRKSQKEAVGFLRNQGLSDKEIVPLIKSDNFINRFFSKVSAKGKKVKQVASNIKTKLGQQFDVLKEEGKEKFLTGSNAVAFDDQLSDVLEKINPRFSRLIEKDVAALRNKGISQKNLIDFYQDINAVVGKEEGGKAVLNILKKPIISGLEEIDPKSASKFSQLNEFYAKGKKFAKDMKPGIIEKLFSGAKALTTLGSLVLGNFAFLGKAIGTHAAQLAIRELMLNPRLQNLTLQMMKSVSQNQIPVALRTLKIFEKELRKTNKEAADAILRSLQENRNEESR